MYKTLHKKQGSVTVQLRFARSSVTFCAKRDNWAVSPKVHNAVLRADNQMLVATPFNNIWIEE